MATEFRVTREKIAQRVSLWLARKLDLTECEEIVGQEYRQLIESQQWSQLQVEGTISVEAPKDTGTVSIANGSQIVQGIGTNFTATDVGRRFRLSSFDQAYAVTAVDVGLQQLTISPAWVSATVIAQTFALYRPIYSLPPETAYLFSLSGRFPIREVPVSELDRRDPTRTDTSDQPVFFCYRGRDASDNLQIEIVPWPTQASLIRYQAVTRDIADTPDHFLKAVEAAIIYTVAASGCLILMAKAIPGQWSDLAQAYTSKSNQVLERLTSLDLSRSSIPTVQRTRDDALWPLFDPDYVVTHDSGLATGDW